MSRSAEIERTTDETKARVALDIDGSGRADVATGVGFFDHLLDALAHHGMFDLQVAVDGDLHIDDHHTVEDTALVLGSAFAEALGDRAGIHRFGSATVPMDEAIATATVDVGGRPYSVIDVAFTVPSIGNFSTENFAHALEAFARTSGTTLHLSASGRNSHHIAEAAIKALGRALRKAVESDPRREGVASTKGTTQ